ncbi:MAG: LytTR family DNA-binding domain-containing protein [Carboxylicivirga sp.]|jgi:DNA-binding LytR/AlgR family response regulator|nr:LytTR family DNA-binding domain-containing protein [Carboxylicivirga sp.]
MSNKISCIIVDDEPVAREILAEHLAKIESIKVLGQCKSALEAFQILSSHAIDLVFLDINMPEISGLDFAKTINGDIKVIFTTAYREYAIDGFDLKAVDYLLKPIAFERLLQAIKKYTDETVPSIQPARRSIESENNDFIFVRADRKMIKIDFSDILYIESLSDYIKIRLENKQVVTRETITNIEAKLPQKDFLRIHRSFIVAINKITSYTNEEVEINEQCLPISRGYKSDVLSRLNAIC